MYGIPEIRNCGLNERKVAPALGTYAATVTDKGHLWIKVTYIA
jgi:hypothetical protein